MVNYKENERKNIKKLFPKPIKLVNTIPISRTVVQKVEDNEDVFEIENNYILYPVALNKFEKTLLLEAIKNKHLVPASVSVSLLRKEHSIYYLPLTHYQINKIRKAEKEKETEINLKISISQIQYFKIAQINRVLLKKV